MRIVYVTTTLPYMLGETFILPEVNELLRQGHELLIVPRSPQSVVPEYTRPLLARTAIQRAFSAQVAKAAMARLCRSPLTTLRTLRLVAGSGRATILAKNLAVYPKGLWLGRVAREWGADHIHAHWAGTTATIALIASEASGIPWSFTAHRWDIVENNLLALKAQRATFARFISQSGLEMARNTGVNGKAQVLHMGVELPAVASSRAGSADPSVILCPANLYPVKGHEYLIAAMAILRDRAIRASLWIAGSGALQNRLERQVAELHLGERVRFLGRVASPELLQLYRDGKVGIVVLPSVDLGNGLHEGIPVALMEAMSYAIPVVSTTTGGIPELLGRDAGLMVPPKDPRALAEALERLSRDPGRRLQLAEGGRKRVEQEFAIHRVVAELVRQFGA